MNKLCRCQMRVVDHPPQRFAAIVTEEFADNEQFRTPYWRISRVKSVTVVKIVEADMLFLGVSKTYFLSDDIEEPGGRPLFLADTISTMAIAVHYLTDGKVFWAAMGTYYDVENSPTVNGLEYKVVDTHWKFHQDDANRILYAVKRYTESL